MAGTDFSTESALDLWKITRSKYGWTNKLTVLQERHDYPIVNQMFQTDKVTFGSGTEIIHDIQISDSGTARMLLPNEPRTYNVGNVMAQIKMPWRQINDYYVTNFQEVSRNRAGSKLVDLLRKRRTACAMSMANKLEELAVKCPASATDIRNPHGFRYWITPITSAQVAAGTTGHQGANPVYLDGNTAASCGGSDASTEANKLWRNYNAKWANSSASITEDDIDTIMAALMDTGFKAPITAKDIDSGSFDNYRHYTNKTLILALERKTRADNDNLGATIGRFRGNVTIKGNPLIRLDDLDSDTSNPLFGVDLSTFMPFVMEGDFFRETGPMNDVEQPDTFITNVDMQFNFACINRRKQFVISYVA